MKNSILTLAILLSAQLSIAQQTTVTTTAPSATIPWTVSLKSELSSNVESSKLIGGGLTETQFRLAYMIGKQGQLGLLLGGKYSLAPEGQPQSAQEMIASDVAIAGIYVAPAILGADKTQIDGRLYLPTSEAAEKAQQQFQVRADISLPYALASQRTASILLSPRYTDYATTPSKLELLSQAKLAQGKLVAPYLAFNHRLKMVDAAAGITRTEETAGPEIGIDIAPHRLVKLSVLMSQERNILNPTSKFARSEYSLFDTNETKYLVGAQIKL